MCLRAGNQVLGIQSRSGLGVDVSMRTCLFHRGSSHRVRGLYLQRVPVWPRIVWSDVNSRPACFRCSHGLPISVHMSGLPVPLFERLKVSHTISAKASRSIPMVYSGACLELRRVSISTPSLKPLLEKLSHCPSIKGIVEGLVAVYEGVSSVTGHVDRA